MFRRFVIVCWVLFFLVALSGVIGGAIGMHNHRLLLNLRDSEMIANNVTDYYAIRSQLQRKSSFEYARLKKARERAGIAPVHGGDSEENIFGKDFLEEVRAIEEKLLEGSETVTVEEGERLSDESRDSADAAAKYVSQLQSGFYVGRHSMWLAVWVLLWNLIWHIGHWVWEGRKVQ